jgi:subtilisin family serine protease
MKKRFLLLLTLFVLPLALSSKELHFYRNGKKVALKENYRNHSFVSDSVTKSLSGIPANVEVLKKEKNTFLLGKLSNSQKSELEKSGKVFPAYKYGKLNYYINDNLFVKIPGSPSEDDASKWCYDNGMELVKRYKYIPDWYLVKYVGNTINKAAELVENKITEQAEPSFFIPLEHRLFIPDDEFFFNQWHLHNFGGSELTGNDHAHIANAWSVLKIYNDSLGKNIKLAIIDDGFDLTHEDLVGRFVNGKNFGDGGEDPLPGPQDAHGTACAGVAAASANNGIGVAGACPECSIIPIRMNMRGPSLDQIAIESFSWAAEQGADIISNSWGPSDGGGAMDMNQPLKDLVFNLTTTGRNGKGIIIFFAAGNGNESIETDGFASNPNVFAIGATNASGNRSSYSDFGSTLDFMAPSNDIDSTSGGDGWGGGSYIDGIWTTDNTNGGYNPGQLAGDPSGKYVGEFGGTSSSCPLAAGITGLVLSANPDLTKDQIYEIYKNTSDKVGDMPYDMNGFNTHYGFGRLNACEAVKMAIEVKGIDVSGVVCGESDHNFDTDVPDAEVDDADAEHTDNDQEKYDGSIGEDDTFGDDEISRKKKDSGCSCSFLNI